MPQVSLDDIRAWLKDQLPGGGAYVDAAPDWLLYVVFGLLVLGVVATLWNGAAWALKRVGLIRDKADVLEKKIDAQQRTIEDQKALLQQVLTALDRRERAADAPALSGEEKSRRDAAAADIVADATPASQAAVADIVAGDFVEAVAKLERDARSATADAAERWRRLGALTRGVDTTKACAAYEEAFRLEPDDFWTCIELARLRQESGDTRGALEAAQCAERAARTDREKSVALDELGDVLVKAGDLAGARTRFESSLAVRERLASANPGSAEAQRDLSVSLERLGDVCEAGGDAAAALGLYQRSQPIAAALAKGLPDHPQFASDLALTERRIAELRAKLGG